MSKGHREALGSFWYVDHITTSSFDGFRVKKFLSVSIMWFRSFLMAYLHILGRSELALPQTQRRPQARC